MQASVTGLPVTITSVSATSPLLATTAVKVKTCPTLRNESGLDVMDTLREGRSGEVLYTSTAPVLAIRAPLELLPVARMRPRIVPADISALVTS